MLDKPQMDKIINDFGKDGVRFLFLFKLLKQRLQNELKREGSDCKDEAKLNKICANAAKELLTKSEKTPTEEEIRKLISHLKEKLKSQD